MPVPTFSGLPPYPSFDDVAEKINRLVNEMRNLLVNLDDTNFDKITAKVIDVNELSAISANLGEITAGLLNAVQIFGSYIATSQSYPRAEMSNTNDLFGTYSTPSRYVKVEANPNILGAPMVNLGFDGTETWLAQVGGVLHVWGPSSFVNFSVNGVNLGGSVQVSGLDSNLGTMSVPAASDPAGAVTSINIMIGALRSMGILA